MVEKSVAEFTTLSKENIAAMLALIGKEEQNTSSPTATVMLSNLKTNLKILFDKMLSFDYPFATVRLGQTCQLDDYYFEHALVPKTAGVTRLSAMASIMNSMVQSCQTNHIKLVAEDEGPHGYEFIFQMGTDPFV